MQIRRLLVSPLFLLVALIVLLAFFTLIGPAERSLGSNVRVVYLHGVWVWTALATFTLAALVGLLGLLMRRKELHLWSRALGRTGLVFWITYLPLSMWAMQTNWNGLFLQEPRWKLAIVFAVGGLFLQVGLTLIENPAWASGFNFVYWLVLLMALQVTEEVMHPASPVFNSDSTRIQVFFVGLLGISLLLAWQVFRWWYQRDLLKFQPIDN